MLAKRAYWETAKKLPPQTSVSELSGSSSHCFAGMEVNWRYMEEYEVLECYLSLDCICDKFKFDRYRMCRVIERMQPFNIRLGNYYVSEKAIGFKISGRTRMVIKDIIGRGLVAFDKQDILLAKKKCMRYGGV